MTASLIKALTPVVIAIALVLGSYFYGKHVSDQEHAAVALRKKVTDLTVIDAAAWADSAKLAEAQKKIAELNKVIEDGRRELADKDAVCFQPDDTDELRKLWQH